MKLKNNVFDSHGSAGFAGFAEVIRAELTKGVADAIILGWMNGSAVGVSGQGPIATIAGARSGKLASSIAWTALCASWGHHALYLDGKGGEISAICELAQTLAGRHVIKWSPLKDGHRINPAGHITRDSPTKVSDIQAFVNNWIVSSGGNNAFFFDTQAKKQLEALAIAVTDRDGVLTLPALYEAVLLAKSPSDDWLNRVGFYMSVSHHPHVRAAEEDIARFHAEPGHETYKGIYGSIENSFAALSDPNVLKSLSPREDGTYDFCFGEMVRDENIYSVFLDAPLEFIPVWGGIIKAMLLSARYHKSRNPASRPMLWCLDEVGNIGPSPIVIEGYTACAGINIRVWGIFQSIKQIANLGPNAENIVLSSAVTQQYFGVRDLPTARMLSERMGDETHYYGDDQAVARAQHAKQQALYGMLGGEDMIASAMKAHHHSQMTETPSVRARRLRNPDEVIHTPPGWQYIFTDAVSAPLYCQKRNYFDAPELSGLYLPNPYHPPADRVQVKTRFGRKWLRVVHEPVPEKYAHLPQYKDGTWTRLEDMK